MRLYAHKSAPCTFTKSTSNLVHWAHYCAPAPHVCVCVCVGEYYTALLKSMCRRLGAGITCTSYRVQGNRERWALDTYAKELCNRIGSDAPMLKAAWWVGKRIMQDVLQEEGQEVQEKKKWERAIILPLSAMETHKEFLEKNDLTRKEFFAKRLTLNKQRVLSKKWPHWLMWKNVCVK